jgi:hypothetical protein
MRNPKAPVEEIFMSASTIAVTPKRRFGQFLILKPAVVEIDGAEVGGGKWSKRTEFATTPGAHVVTVSFPYLGKRRIAEATLSVTVAEGGTTELLYRSPWIVTNAGSLTVRP